MATRRKTTKKAEAKSRGLAAADTVGDAPADVQKLQRRIEHDGGAVLASYREPLGSHWLVLAALPIDKVQPTPYQRDLSPAHEKRMVHVLDKLGTYLDPIIATPEDAGIWWTPNGNHRLAAMRQLGARAITALVVPDRDIAFQILALNTEKAHNLKDKALEVIRMARALAAADGGRSEAELSLQFEDPVLLTLGPCYERDARFSGGAYRSALGRVETFLDEPLGKTLKTRDKRAALLMALDEKVAAVIAALKARGLQSPYLRAFVTARINPIRFAKTVDLSPEELLQKMTAAAARFDAGKVEPEQIQASAGPPDEAEA
ncbi:MAG TPA: ParB N-terminal domain-containing protein [Planctomycetota bacterium]|nr:ParB N-terminal domain-containing protein [Planctomycetota bacterium]